MIFNGHKPIYLQIYDHVCERILNGGLRSGDRVMSVRELGIELGGEPKHGDARVRAAADEGNHSDKTRNRILRVR